MRDMKVKQVLFVGRYQREGRGHKEMVREYEYIGCILYSCMKMEY
jgi:hypothetical protein